MYKTIKNIDLHIIDKGFLVDKGLKHISTKIQNGFYKH